MKKEGGTERITISITKKTLKELDDYCSKTKPVVTARSPIIELSIQDYLKRENKDKK
ncbi:hypothetical protein J4461_04555 [Candidatus Pacearchaeota archaeon]|nr:hypothetical protein [Candidatus Pacearchaeota archaeon]